jgi:DNA recombination protein RmuC
METVVVAIASGVLCAAIAVWLLQRKAGGTALQELHTLHQQQLQIILEQFNQQRQTVEASTGQLNARMTETGRVVYDLQSKLSQVNESTRHVLDMHKGITELQNILQAPKLRGERGEVWLEELLLQVIPRQHVVTQHRFSTGDVVDAVIKLRDNLLLPIDSKFTLENFKKLSNAEGAEAKQYEKLFIADVKKRIDEIAKKYILPSEGTLDFACMYVPAENVYYQAFIEDIGGANLTRYAFERHVIPVSPNSLYPYLEIVLFGLRGVEIERNAHAIQQGLSELQGDLRRFDEEYRKLGGHLRNAQGSFEASDKRLGRVQLKVGTMSKQDLNLVEPTITLPENGPSA